MSKYYAIHDFRGVTAHRYVLLKYISVKIAKKKAVFTVHQNLTSALVHFFLFGPPHTTEAWKGHAEIVSYLVATRYYRVVMPY